MITDISEESDIDIKLREALMDIEDSMNNDLSRLKSLFHSIDKKHIKSFRIFLTIVMERHENIISAIKTIRKERA